MATKEKPEAKRWPGQKPGKTGERKPGVQTRRRAGTEEVNAEDIREYVENKLRDRPNGAEVVCITLDSSDNDSSSEELEGTLSDDEDKPGQCQKQGSECPDCFGDTQAGTLPEDPGNYFADDNNRETEGGLQTLHGGPVVMSQLEEIKANVKRAKDLSQCARLGWPGITQNTL